jgi:hypothetical protein
VGVCLCLIGGKLSKEAPDFLEQKFQRENGFTRNRNCPL